MNTKVGKYPLKNQSIPFWSGLTTPLQKSKAQRKDPIQTPKDPFKNWSSNANPPSFLPKRPNPNKKPTQRPNAFAPCLPLDLNPRRLKHDIFLNFKSNKPKSVKNTFQSNSHSKTNGYFPKVFEAPKRSYQSILPEKRSQGLQKSPKTKQLRKDMSACGFQQSRPKLRKQVSEINIKKRKIDLSNYRGNNLRSISQKPKQKEIKSHKEIEKPKRQNEYFLDSRVFSPMNRKETFGNIQKPLAESRSDIKSKFQTVQSSPVKIYPKRIKKSLKCMTNNGNLGIPNQVKSKPKKFSISSFTSDNTKSQNTKKHFISKLESLFKQKKSIKNKKNAVPIVSLKKPKISEKSLVTLQNTINYHLKTRKQESKVTKKKSDLGSTNETSIKKLGAKPKTHVKKNSIRINLNKFEFRKTIPSSEKTYLLKDVPKNKPVQSTNQALFSSRRQCLKDDSNKNNLQFNSNQFLTNLIQETMDYKSRSISTKKVSKSARDNMKFKIDSENVRTKLFNKSHQSNGNDFKKFIQGKYMMQKPKFNVKKIVPSSFASEKQRVLNPLKIYKKTDYYGSNTKLIDSKEKVKRIIGKNNKLLEIKPEDSLIFQRKKQIKNLNSLKKNNESKGNDYQKKEKVIIAETNGCPSIQPKLVPCKSEQIIICLTKEIKDEKTKIDKPITNKILKSKSIRQYEAPFTVKSNQKILESLTNKENKKDLKKRVKNRRSKSNIVGHADRQNRFKELTPMSHILDKSPSKSILKKSKSKR